MPEAAAKIEPGQWIEAYDGYGLAMFVAVSWHEQYESLPEGVQPGQEKMTTVVYKRLCDYKGKGKMMVAACNVRLCNPIELKGKELVDRLLTDPKMSVRFEDLSVPPNFGLVVNLRYDLPQSKAKSVTAAVERFRVAEGSNFIFDRLADAVPALARPHHSAAFDAPAGMVTCELQMVNAAFATRDKKRVFSGLKWTTK